MEKRKEKNKEAEGRVNKKQTICPWIFFLDCQKSLAPSSSRLNVKTERYIIAGRVGRSFSRSAKNDFNMHAYKWKDTKWNDQQQKKMNQSNKWDVNSEHTAACMFSVEKSHFAKMRCAYRPVPQRCTTMGNTAKMGKGNHANGMICQIQRSFRERISSKRRRSCKKERSKNTKWRNAPKSPILIMVLFQLYSSIAVCSLWRLAPNTKTAVNFMICSSLDLFAQFSHFIEFSLSPS